MPSRNSQVPEERDDDELLEDSEASLLDLVDNLLNKGVVLDGELIIGVAGIDLVYLRLTALLAAADRVLPRSHPQPPRKTLPPPPFQKKR